MRINPDRHGPRLVPNDFHLPYPPYFSLLSTFQLFIKVKTYGCTILFITCTLIKRICRCLHWTQNLILPNCTDVYHFVCLSFSHILLHFFLPRPQFSSYLLNFCSFLVLIFLAFLLVLSFLQGPPFPLFFSSFLFLCPIFFSARPYVFFLWLSYCGA